MTTNDTPESADVDRDQVKLFGFKVWTYKMGEQVALMIHIGDQLGIYRAMAGQGALTAEAVAQSLELHPRFVREWLLGQAAADLITRHSDGRFELTDVAAEVLANEDSSADFAVGAFRGGIEPELVERLVESFRTGVGLTYEEQGPAAAAGMTRMTAPRSRLTLLTTVLPGLDGVMDKLAAGGKVIDVGCGGGVTLATLAEGFPNTTCVGYDPSASAIELARERTAEAGLTNITFEVAGASEIPPTGDADLVICFDCLHDMTRPDIAAETIRRAIAEDGTWLIKDIRSTGDFDLDRRNPLLALFYSFSITSCLQSAMSQPDGLGLGTLGLHPERAKELTTAAGFDQFAQHDFDDASNLYYEVRV